MPGKWNLLSMQPKTNASEPIISKAKIGKTQEKSKCYLCQERDKTKTDILRECNKLIQKKYLKKKRIWGNKDSDAMGFKEW